MAYAVPTALRSALAALADALLPLADWVKSKPYVPDTTSFIPAIEQMPWRGGGAALNADSLELIRAFEYWVDHDATDEALSPRWLMLKTHPTAFFQYRTDAASWRAARGLHPDAKFAPFTGQGANMSYVFARPDDPKDPGDPVPRARYYDESWRLLAQAIEAEGAVIPDWNAFADKLLADGSGAWKAATSVVSSSSFIKRFAADLLIACMGQKNPALANRDPIWLRAVLIEAGENRHPGNEYGPAATAQAVAAMLGKLDVLPPKP